MRRQLRSLFGDSIFHQRPRFDREDGPTSLKSLGQRSMAIRATHFRLAFVAAVACASCHAATAEGVKVPLVALSTPRLQKEDGPQDSHPLLSRVLHRELWREAILLTAREEFGCATSDQSLAEPLPANADVSFDVNVETRRRSGSHVALRRGDQLLFEREVNYDVGPVFDFALFCDLVAPLTRSDLVPALKKCGLDRKGVKRQESAPLPKGVEPLLRSTNYIAQFRALRSIHAAIRESGESPERLNGLARGYANLAQEMLTTLDARGSAYFPRALLYAERLRNSAPDAPDSQWCTAYVYCLGGFPTLALQAIDSARQLNSSAPPPDWAQLIEDACRHRYADLQKVAADDSSDLQKLGALFLFRTAFASGNPCMIVDSAKTTLSKNPDSLCVIDLLHMSVGVALNHSTSLMGPQWHGRLLSRELQSVEMLPAKTADLLNDSELADFLSIARVARSLKEVSRENDPYDPSLASLGADIDALNVLHLFRRALFIRRSLGLDATDVIRSNEAAIADNTWAPMIRTLAVAPTERLEPYQQAIGDFRFVDANGFSSIQLFQDIPPELTVGEVAACDAYWTALSAKPGSEFDFVMRLIQERDKKTRITYARWMEDSSLHAPIRLAVLLRDDERLSNEVRAERERQHADHPVVLAAMGEYYAAHQNPERALELMERSLAVVPDPRICRAAATLYFRQGDDKWKGTLERVFDHPDLALDHAEAACTIASTLMREGKYEDALPWAERASKSGAGWAWRVECDCRTALQQWQEAENLARMTSERYGGFEWYNWCLENHRGDLTLAWKAKQALLQARYEPRHRSHELAQTIHLLATEDYSECLRSLIARADQTQKPFDMMWIALLADRQGNAELRDEWLGKMAARANNPAEPLFDLAPAFQQFLAANDEKIEPIERAVKAVEEIHPAYGLRARYFAGQLLEKHVSKDAAIRMWSPAAGLPNGVCDDDRALLRRALADAGVKLSEIDGWAYTFALPAK
jgi:tetratricopeptide (TPR) repeat protein